MDGDIIENLEDYRYLGARNGYPYLYEIREKDGSMVVRLNKLMVLSVQI